MTYRCIHLKLVRHGDFIVQWTDYSHDAPRSVNSKKAGGRLNRVQHTSACALIRICGIHNINWSSHWCVLKERKHIQCEINRCKLTNPLKQFKTNKLTLLLCNVIWNVLLLHWQQITLFIHLFILSTANNHCCLGYGFLIAFQGIHY